MARPAVVVSGALANKPWNGGAAWTRMSWTLGFAKLGYDVLFVEQLGDEACVDAGGAKCAPDVSTNLAFFHHVTRRFAIDAALIVENGHRVIGADWDTLIARAEAADLLVNISGHLTIPRLKNAFRTRVFVDLDPGYTQFWHEDGLAEDQLSGHHHYFTVGENVGRAGCAISAGGISWRPIRQPVVLDDWRVTPTSSNPIRFTTVASWRGPLGRVQRHDTLFGVKAHEFRKFAALPARTGYRYEVALEAGPADRGDIERLQTGGWEVVPAKDAVPAPDAFREYVQGSSAECSVAQGIYVETNSGWFSDRTVRYLASGKPALVQDTGWSRNYPCGEGLLPFRTFEEAVTGSHSIVRDYARHARRARAIAEEFFDSGTVLTGLLEAIA